MQTANNKALDAESPTASFLKSVLIGGGPINRTVLCSSRQEHVMIRLNRPVTRMREFSSRLGWNSLQLYSTASWPEKFDSHWGIDRLYWYQTTDPKFFLAIHEAPFNQTKTYRATIKAFRYGMTLATPMPFELFEDQEEFDGEVTRLMPMLERSNWKSKDWRKKIGSGPTVYLHFSKKKKRGAK